MSCQSGRVAESLRALSSATPKFQLTHQASAGPVALPWWEGTSCTFPSWSRSGTPAAPLWLEWAPGMHT